MSELLATLPVGWDVTFEDGSPDENGKSKRRSYLVDGEKFISVTTGLGVIEKPGLKYAAEKLAVEGCIQLARDGELPLQADGALSRMKKQGLRFWQVWSAKAARGTLAHEDLLAIARGEEQRAIGTYTDDDRGFIRGVSDWYADTNPTVEHSELIVASKAHKFAGRLDLIAEIDGERWLLDLKTQGKPVDPKSDPYPEHLLQLAGYALAAEESGYGHVDRQGVIRVGPDGSQDLKESWATPEQFLSVLSAYHAVKFVTGRRPRKVAA